MGLILPFVLLCALCVVVFQFLSRWPLAAVFVECHGGGVGDVVRVRKAPDGNFDNCIDERELFIGKTEAFVTDNEGGAAREAVVVEADGVGGLLKADERVALFLQILEYRR